MILRQFALFLTMLLFTTVGMTANASSPFEQSLGNDDFLPVDEAYQLSVDVEADQVVVLWQIAEGYYLYRHAFDFSAKDLVAGTEIPLEPAIPEGKHKIDDYFGEVQVYYHQAVVPIPVNSNANFELTITSQGCADAGLCYPPQNRYFHIDFSQQKATPLEPGQTASSANPAGNQQPSNPGESNINSADTEKSLVFYAFAAMLGGLILNLMPCVFPVLTLKVLSLTGKDPASSHFRMHGIVYTFGVVISFVAVAGLMLALRSAGEAIGWGFQLQNPWFVGGLTYLFFIMGLSLAGYIELGSNLMGIGQGLASKQGYSGSFFTGVLAVVVASPCTAPFMGSALGFAINAPATTALTIFAALGFGMALPFLLLSLIPALAAGLPKPGPWMDALKRILAFPMFATCIWLAWVAGNQTSANGMALLLIGCLLIALALWLLNEPVKNSALSKIKLTTALAIAITALSLLQSPYLQPAGNSSTTGGKDWQPYSKATLNSLRADGKAVFVNITADWCITCLANERVTLSQDRIKQAFEQQNITYLKGDWTNYDARITSLLNEYQRSGIPLYLYFPPQAMSEAVVLPQILSPEIVLDTIKANPENRS